MFLGHFAHQKIRSIDAKAQFSAALTSAAVIARSVLNGKVVRVLSDSSASPSGETIVRTAYEHLKLVRTLDRSGARSLLRRYPHYANKYFHLYLLKQLHRRTRRNILAFHHRYLSQHTTASVYDAVFNDRPTLWTKVIGGARYSISLSFDHDGHAEGDLSLLFEKDDIPIYEMSFAIVPGQLIGSTSSKVLLVARMQGKRNKIEAIRAATLACHRIAPPHLLIAALKPIAAVLEIDTILGVTNKQQITRASGNDSSLITMRFGKPLSSRHKMRTGIRSR